jgi:cytolysin (calcineurin-like family phosphatase)
LNKQTIDLMNRAPGLPLPVNVGPAWVGTPRGVVLNGDLLDRGFEKDAAGHWAEWVRDYGLNGADGRLAFPVYEGFGNHDGGPTRSVTRAAVRERNKTRVGLSGISANGLHYSWDWDQVHLVQVNLFGGDGPDDVQNVSKSEHNPEEALEFLRQDLAARVGASGRPVIVFQHFSWIGGMSDWWTMEAKDRFHAVVAPYNVAALINGHSHGASFIEWKGLQTIHDGATARPDGGSGDFLIVNVTPDELRVIQRKPDGWGITLRRPLRSVPGPTP